MRLSHHGLDWLVQHRCSVRLTSKEYGDHDNKINSSLCFFKPFLNNVCSVAGWNILPMASGNSIAMKGVPGLQWGLCRWRVSDWRPHGWPETGFPSRTMSRASQSLNLCHYIQENIMYKKTGFIWPDNLLPQQQDPVLLLFALGSFGCGHGSSLRLWPVCTYTGPSLKFLHTDLLQLMSLGRPTCCH